MDELARQHKKEGYKIFAIILIWILVLLLLNIFSEKLP